MAVGDKKNKTKSKTVGNTKYTKSNVKKGGVTTKTKKLERVNGPWAGATASIVKKRGSGERSTTVNSLNTNLKGSAKRKIRKVVRKGVRKNLK